MGPPTDTRGKWLALTAALLGWMFDGLEMGLFPLVARPALRDLLHVNDEGQVGLWFSVATAGFLVGAATGGVLFGWLGDRLGRVRAMVVSVLTYAVFSGLCSGATAAWQIAVLRFVSALGMGGEWSLGVALVMEIWPNSARGLLAGLIGAIGNVGYLLIAVLGWYVGRVLAEAEGWLRATGLSEGVVQALTANGGWRLLMLLGAAPALLTLFIQFFVPESRRWQEEKSRGAVSHWAARDLLAVLAGGLAACGMIFLWAADSSWLGPHTLALRVQGSALALVLVTAGYAYPVIRYLQRSDAAEPGRPVTWLPTVGRMLLGALLGGVPLLVTWAAVQWLPLWADQMAGTGTDAKSYTQMAMSLGAILGTLAGALIGDRLGRRLAYTTLCSGSLAAAYVTFNLMHSYGWPFLISAFITGGLTASFYGWLPLYLPELFRTRVRATGQGFSYNFGRVLAAVGVLQTGNLMSLFANNYPKACWVMSMMYVVGLVVIWLAPETRGKPLPD